VVDVRRYQGELTATTSDFDLHGVVGLRLLDATAADRATVARQIGLTQSPLNRTPDVVIRFVNTIPISGPLRLLGLDTGFSRQPSLVLLARHRAGHGAALIPLHEVGGRCELLCERGLLEIPLLVEILNLTALAKGLLPLHAAAFARGPVGVVVTGWSKGGKTETLLAFMRRGAFFVGDEWVYMTGDGREALGIGHPIRLWDWQLRQLPDYRRKLTRRQRRRLDIIRALLTVHQAVPWANGAPGPLRPLDAMGPILERRHGVYVDPVTVFGASRVRSACSFDRLFFVESRSVKSVEVHTVDGAEVADRMRFSLQYERRALVDAYLKFRFAFPRLRNPVLEQAPELEGEALSRIFGAAPAYLVAHPYPVRIEQLWEKIGPLL
jgi:hypothetical protein